MSDTKHEGAKIPESDKSIIDSGMANLERNIRELHDRLVTVMRPPDVTAEDAPERPHRSPMAENISLMDELITDIHHRLEL
jgi:hypothetical protein